MNKTEIRKITHLLKPILKITNAVNNKPQRLILMYHGIAERAGFNCIAKELFRDHIAWLKEHYTIVSLAGLLENLSSPNTRNVHMAAITFDDGYANFYEHAVPILKEFHCHATVFVPSGKVGHYNDWDERGSYFQKMPIMSFEQLRDLPHGLVEIGSHGISHKALSHLSPDEVERELLHSREALEQKIGRRVRFLAFPYGKIPVAVDAAGRKRIRHSLSAYEGACTILWGRFNTVSDLYALRRIGIWETDSFDDYCDKLKGYYDWLAVRQDVVRSFKLKYLSPAKRAKHYERS